MMATRVFLELEAHMDSLSNLQLMSRSLRSTEGGPRIPPRSRRCGVKWAQVRSCWLICSLLDAFWAHVLALVAFCCCAGPILVRLGALRARFWRVPGGLREGFGAPGPYSSTFLHACTLASSKCSECNKTTILVDQKTGRKHRAQREKSQKIAFRAF